MEVQRHFQGPGIEEAAARRGSLQTGLLLSPAVLSEGQPRVKMSPRRKEGARRAGSNAGYGREDCVSPAIILPCSHTQRDSVARRPFGLGCIYMLGAASAQRGRAMRCTCANINILHKEPLMCAGRSPGLWPPLSGPGSERTLRTVSPGAGRWRGAGGSDSQPA